MKGNYWNDYVRVPWNVYVIGDCCYRVRVEETRKELSYLSAIGVVTTEGNFNTVPCKSEPWVLEHTW